MFLFSYMLLLSLFSIIIGLFFGITDAYISRRKEDSDNIGWDYPFWVKKYIHIWWLGGLILNFSFIYWLAILSPFNIIKTFLIMMTIFFALSGLCWDITFAYIKTGKLITEKTMQWWLSIPGIIRISFKTRKDVIRFHIMRIIILLGMWVYAYI